MEKYTSPEETLSEIRHLMERSSRFISLSGMSGVMAGVYALLGTALVYYILESETTGFDLLVYLAAVAAIVLILAVGTGILLTTRKAKKDGNSLLDTAAKKLLTNLSIPLVTGGIFCVALLYNGDWSYLAGTMLTFYGLALVHASKYTRNDIRSLGMSEITLGVIALFVHQYGLVLWATGFGVLHIAYGVYMYYKYER